jgi:hypothetical protein
MRKSSKFNDGFYFKVTYVSFKGLRDKSRDMTCSVMQEKWKKIGTYFENARAPYLDDPDSFLKFVELNWSIRDKLNNLASIVEPVESLVLGLLDFLNA